MPIITELPPLSLYIHLPWCVQKCPYCDFNSHALKDNLPEELYVGALMRDLEKHLDSLQNRPLISIFFGGGTPSLFSPAMIKRILDGVKEKTAWHTNIEITMEANPGTIDSVRFFEFREAGINRLSLGLQSLEDKKLKTLGRIHDSEQAMNAIRIAKEAGFDNFNLDLMYGLPEQSIEQALTDLEMALAFKPTHLSWYQLTIEPNTVFYKQRPTLPPDDYLYDMQLKGQAYLAMQGFKQYEVSAYATPQKECVHNRNYWEFGDYLGIGAGAHSKITDLQQQTITRFAQVKQPRDYMLIEKQRDTNVQVLAEKDLAFEFMLNALRLSDGFDERLYSLRTGLPFAMIEETLIQAMKRGLLERHGECIVPSALGKQFLNDLVGMFL